MKTRIIEKITMKLIDAAIPATVGLAMLGVTYFITNAVRSDILTIAEQAAVNAVDKAFATTEPAIEWKQARALTPVVRAGGVLEIEYTALILKQCPSDLRTFLLNNNTDSASYRFPDQSGGYRRASPDLQTWLVKIAVNDPPLGSGFPPLEPGNYTYRATAIRYCDRIEFDSMIPDVAFKLIR